MSILNFYFVKIHMPTTVCYLKYKQESILLYFFSLCFPLYMFPLICVSFHVILLCISFLRGVLSILLSTYVLSFLTFHKNGPFPKGEEVKVENLDVDVDLN